MNDRRSVRLAEILILWATAGVAIAANGVAVAEAGDGCQRLEAGSGDSRQPHAVPYTANAAGSLRIDLGHDVSMIAFPGNVGFDPNFAVALKPARDGKWSLTYAVDKGVFRPSRAFRATVPVPSALAQRVAAAWGAAVAAANQDTASACFGLDGKSYAFSASGQQAHVWQPHSGVPARVVEIADTLKTIALDTNNTGYATQASQARLAAQLDDLESALQSDSQNLIGSSRP